MYNLTKAACFDCGGKIAVEVDSNSRPWIGAEAVCLNSACRMIGAVSEIDDKLEVAFDESPEQLDPQDHAEVLASVNRFP